MVGQAASIGVTRLGQFPGVRTGRRRRGRLGQTVNLIGAVGVRVPAGGADSRG